MRQQLRNLALLVAVVALVVAAGLPVYVFPHSDPIPSPAAADAVVVIGPANTAQLALANRYLGERVARELVVSVPDPGQDPLCAASATVDAHCFRPDPFTTRGEAMHVRDLARAEHWGSVIVITAGVHVVRTRFIFDQCEPAGLHVAAVGVREHLAVDDWVFQYVYQTAGFVKAAVLGC